MASSAEFIIHIGAPKTGSTVLQRLLFDNRNVLEPRGILYPDVSLRGYGHHDLAFLLGGGYPEWATTQPKTLDELCAQLADLTRSYDGTIVLSSEDFYLCPNPQGLFDLLSATGAFSSRTARIIVYVRRQDDAHESWFNQTIKAQGSTLTMDESLAKFDDLFDYEKRLDAWSAVFGAECMEVRPYEKQAFQHGSLIDDFLTLLSTDRNGLTVTTERMNTSLNRDLLEYQRIVNSLPLSTVQRRRHHHSLMALTEATRGSDLFDQRSLLDRARRSQILERYAAGNGVVARRYLQRDELFEDASFPPDVKEPATGLTLEKLAAISAWLLCHDA